MAEIIQDNYIFGQDYQLSTTTQLGFSHPGYTFNGWYCSDGDVHADGDIVKFNTTSSEITASWDPIKYNIQYNMNGGDNSDSNPSCYTIESKNIIFQDPEKGGSSFIKWTDDNGTEISSITQGTTGDFVVNANWEKRLGTLFILSDDSSVIVQDDIMGTSLSVLSASAKMNGKFVDIFGTSDTSIFKKVDCSEEITATTNYSLGSCSQLTSFVGTNVQLVRDGTFSTCKKLETVKLPSVNTIGGSAFMSCQKLSSLTIGDTIKQIKTQAFYLCYGLVDIQLHDVERVSQTAFGNCTHLQTVHLGNLLSVNVNAFTGCSKLTTLDFSNRTITDMPIFESPGTTWCWNTLTVILPQDILDVWQAKVDDPTELTESEQIWVDQINAGKITLQAKP